MRAHIFTGWDPIPCKWREEERVEVDGASDGPTERWMPRDGRMRSDERKGAATGAWNACSPSEDQRSCAPSATSCPQRHEHPMEQDVWQGRDLEAHHTTTLIGVNRILCGRLQCVCSSISRGADA